MLVYSYRVNKICTNLHYNLLSMLIYVGDTVDITILVVLVVLAAASKM